MLSFALLDPRPAAADDNAALLRGSAQAYLYEVTAPHLVTMCEDMVAACEHFDPQHTGGDPHTAAIEAAATGPYPAFCITRCLGMRPDLDTIGAMAVTQQRTQMGEYGIFRLPPDHMARVKQIAEMDKEAARPWPGPRPLSRPEDLLGPLSALSALAMDHRLPLEERIYQVAHWIQSGRTAAPLDEYQAAVEAEARAALENLRVEMVDGVAVVTGTHRFAFHVGYRFAPIVVAINPEFRWQGGEPHLKYTVARWNSGTLAEMDWPGMVGALNVADPAVTPKARWDGSTSIVGSPQGVGSQVARGQVVEVVAGAAREALAALEARKAREAREAGRRWRFAWPLARRR